EMAEARFQNEGATLTQAQFAAHRQFGNITAALEQSRDIWRFVTLEDLANDIRYAARNWVRNPAFAVTVIATIGLALGLNTALFTAFDHYVLRPLAVRDPGTLYQMEWGVKSGSGHFFTWEEFQRLREQTDIISGSYAAFGVVGQIDQQPAVGQIVTPDFFEILGARVSMGRPFTPADAPAPNSGAYIVLGHNCWTNKFGSDPAILGRRVFVRGQPFEVIGVAAAEFTGIGPVPVDFWVPLTMYASLNNGTNLFAPTKTGSLVAVIRLRQDISLNAAKSALLAWSRRQTQNYPDDQKAVSIHLESRANALPLNADVLLAFAPIFIGFSLILLTACANVSNMMLARAVTRQREIGIRLALGAGRLRLIRQLLTEAFLLSLPAAVAGLVISEVTVRGIRELFYRTIPSRFGKVLQFPEMQPDYRVFGFVLLAAIVTTLLFGLIPAIQATRADFGKSIRSSRLRNALVVAQVLICALLLITSLLILRSETRVANRDLRLDPRGVIDIRLQSKFASRIEERLRREPLIESVAAVSQAPLYKGLPMLSIGPAGNSQRLRSYFNMVSPEYFEVLRMPLASGRNFTPAEAAAGAPVAIVSEATAHRLWPGESPLGQEIDIETTRDNRFSTSPAYTRAQVVGVARDVVNGYAAESVDSACLYFPVTAANVAVTSLLVRVHGDVEKAHNLLDRLVHETAPGAAERINPLEEVVETQLYPFRVLSWLGGFLAALAMGLVVSGIYGVLSFLVNQRRKEIGIRVAMGASTRDVVALVLGQSLRLALIGATLGAAFALAIAPLLAQEIYALRPYEVLPYGITVGLVLTAAAAAAFVPSRRASRLDAATTLRSD
ncbi:MAG: ADOP family duplicated permease, partial [Saprospiraceae bacterium]